MSVCQNSFKSNNGGGIVRDKSTISFSKHTHASFLGNVADNGGAIHSTENSSILFEENSMVHFTNNHARNHGGTIYTSA